MSFIKVSTEDFAEVYLILEKLNKLLHADRTYNEFVQFQHEYYELVSKFYHKNLDEYLNEKFCETVSEYDMDPEGVLGPNDPPFETHKKYLIEILEKMIANEN